MKECDACGKRTKNSRFCSRQCSARVTNAEAPRRRAKIRPTKICKLCGTQFETSTPTQVLCSKECRDSRNYKKFASHLVVNSRMRGPYIKTYCIKYKLLALKCNECGITEWNGKPAPLELDHKNGEKTDNRLENLQILCANCHAQTPTYRWKNAHRKRRERESMTL